MAAWQHIILGTVSNLTIKTQRWFIATEEKIMEKMVKYRTGIENTVLERFVEKPLGIIKKVTGDNAFAK